MSVICLIILIAKIKEIYRLLLGYFARKKDRTLINFNDEVLNDLENKLREAVDFRGTPIKIIARENNEEIF